MLWGEELKGKRVVTKNKPAVAIISPDIMKLLRFFFLQCLKFNLAFCAKHIPSESNVADALSRFQMERFQQLAPSAAKTGIPVPQFLWTI